MQSRDCVACFWILRGFWRNFWRKGFPGRSNWNDGPTIMPPAAVSFHDQYKPRVRRKESISRNRESIILGITRVNYRYCHAFAHPKTRPHLTINSESATPCLCTSPSASPVQAGQTVISGGFDRPHRLQLGAKDSIPETARDAKAVLIVGEMMLEVVLLELAIVRRQAGEMSVLSMLGEIPGSTYLRW